MAWSFFALSAAVLWGAGYLMYELLLKSISASTSLFASYFGTMFVYAAWVFASGTGRADWAVLRQGGTEAKLLAGIVATGALANLAFLASMRLKNATVSGMIEITYPLFTALFAWVFLQETQASPGAFFGFFLILMGIACIFYFEKTT